LRAGSQVQPKAFNRLTSMFAVSVDGTKWALTEGFDAMCGVLQAG
jgi:hypothetical protein